MRQLSVSTFSSTRNWDYLRIDRLRMASYSSDKINLEYFTNTDGIIARDAANGYINAFVLCELDETVFLLVSRSQTRLNDLAERHMVLGGRCFYYRRN